MKLKTRIFLWVAIAAILPLAILALGVTFYSETSEHRKVAQQVTRELSNIISAIDYRLYYDRQMILSVANSQPMSEYLAVLESLGEKKLHEQYFLRGQRVNHFLESVQTIVPGFRTVRVITARNKTMVRISKGSADLPTGDGIEKSPFIEEDNGGDEFLAKLSRLPEQEVSFIVTPQSRFDWEDLRGPPMLSGVVPLVRREKRVGYLVVSFNGEPIDRILELAPRIHRGRLLVAELNPEDTERNGMVLYEDSQGMRFAHAPAAPINLRLMEGGKLWDSVRRTLRGEFTSDRNLYQTFYVEHSPYANRLASWVIAMRIDLAEVRAPFYNIRLSIFLLCLVALLLSLGVAELGARQVAYPVSLLTETLKSYGEGKLNLRSKVQGTDEVRQLENAFNYMADHLEQAQDMMLQSAKLASIGQMAAGIGHEINNPLNNILSLSKLLARALANADEGVKKDLSSLREEALRATEIVGGVLNFARQVPPQYSTFAVKPWLVETLKLVKQIAKERPLVLTFRGDESLLLSGDRHQLQQVLVNLVINAVQASTADSSVVVDVVSDQEYLYIHVIDQGRGIPSAQLDQIFDPFFTTKPEGQGTGLGLSISLGIVDRHQGKLMVSNNADCGVTATVQLPLLSRYQSS